MDSHEILEAMYQIQGLSDPAHLQTVKQLQERMKEIYEHACRVMRGTGYHPDDD